MAKADSGIQSPSRFFSFRWMYVVLASVLWLNLLIIIFSTSEFGNLAPAYLIQNMITGRYSDLAGLGLHGVFGLDLYYNHEGSAAFAFVILLGVSIAALIVPESGNSRHLPALRGMHLRAKIVCALATGVAATAFIAGLLDVLEVDLVPFFTEMAWMPVKPSWHYSSTATDYEPSSGSSPWSPWCL